MDLIRSLLDLAFAALRQSTREDNKDISPAGLRLASFWPK